MESNNKTVLITGGTRGIGEKLVYEFANKGYNISLCGRNQDDCQLIVKKMEKAFPEARVFAISCDMRDLTDVEKCVTATIANFGRIDVLINNAGIGCFGSFEEFDISEIDNIMSTNFRGAVLITKQVLPYMKKNDSSKKGIVVFIGSSCDEIYFPGNSIYASSKAALRTFADYLFGEYRTEGIFSTYVSLGSVDTRFSTRFSDDTKWKLSPGDVAKAVSHLVELMYSCDGMCISSVDIRTMNPIKVPLEKE